MSTLEGRVKRLETRRFRGAEQALRALSDKELEALWKSTLARLSDEDFELACQEQPGRRSRFEEYRHAPLHKDSPQG